MSTVPDVDALLLFAVALAAKRRPADPVAIVAAVDLVHRNIPGEDKLSEAFARLGASGLLQAAADGVTLSAAGEGLIEALPAKGDHAARLGELRRLLAARGPAAGGAAIVLGAETLRAAIVAHRAAVAGGGKNLLVPKPKSDGNQSRPGQRRRKPMPKARRH